MSPFSAGWARCLLLLVQDMPPLAPDWPVSPCWPMGGCHRCRLAPSHWLKSAFSTTHLAREDVRVEICNLSDLLGNISLVLFISRWMELFDFWQFVSVCCMINHIRKLESESPFSKRLKRPFENAHKDTWWFMRYWSKRDNGVHCTMHNAQWLPHDFFGELLLWECALKNTRKLQLPF